MRYFKFTIMIIIALIASACAGNGSDILSAADVPCDEIEEVIAEAANEPSANLVSLFSNDEERLDELAERETECDEEFVSNPGSPASERPAPQFASSAHDGWMAWASAPTECETFTVMLPSREGNRLNADGIPEDIRDDPEAIREFIDEQAQRDPLTLFHYHQASPLGEGEYSLENPLVLVVGPEIVDGACYSDIGVKAYERWKALWDVASLETVAQVTHTGFNTGVDENQEPTSSDGVTGSDQSGVDVVYQDAGGNDAGEHSVLNRCTQPTTPDRPENTPDGETDNPEPKPEGKDHRKSPVVSDPDHEDERVRPREPIDPAPPAPALQPSEDPSGSPGTIETDPDDDGSEPSVPGTDEGISDPEPEPSPPPEDEPVEPNDPSDPDEPDPTEPPSDDDEPEFCDLPENAGHVACID